MVYNITSNLTGLLNATTASDLVDFANVASNGYLGNLFIISVAIIMLLTMNRFDFRYNIVVTSWFCFILSVLLAAIGIVTYAWWILFLIIAVVSVFWLNYSSPG